MMVEEYKFNLFTVIYNLIKSLAFILWIKLEFWLVQNNPEDKMPADLWLYYHLFIQSVIEI